MDGVGWTAETARPGTCTFTSAALSDNTYSFTATATDAADNTSAAVGGVRDHRRHDGGGAGAGDDDV